MDYQERERANKAALQLLKVGEEAYVSSWNAYTSTMEKVRVERLTKTQIIVVHGRALEVRYRRDDGREVGVSYGRPRQLWAPDEYSVRAYKRHTLQVQAGNAIYEIDQVMRRTSGRFMREFDAINEASKKLQETLDALSGLRDE